MNAEYMTAMGIQVAELRHEAQTKLLEAEFFIGDEKLIAEQRARTEAAHSALLDAKQANYQVLLQKIKNGDL